MTALFFDRGDLRMRSPAPPPTPSHHTTNASQHGVRSRRFAALAGRRTYFGTPLLTPKLTNATIKRAVKDYYNGNPRLKREVIKLFGKIQNWDVSSVTNMSSLFANAHSFNQPLNNWNVSYLVHFGGSV